MARSRRGRTKIEKDLQKVYKTFFENKEIKEYIRENIAKHVTQLSALEKTHLRKELKVTSSMTDSALVEALVHFLKHCSMHDGQKQKKTAVVKRKKSVKVNIEPEKVVVSPTKPSEIAGLLSIVEETKEKKDSEWYNYLKGKLIVTLSFMTKLGSKVLGKLSKLASDIAKYCTEDFYHGFGCYAMVWVFCSSVNQVNVNSLSGQSYYAFYALQSLCSLVPGPFKNTKQNADRKAEIEKVAEKYHLEDIIDPGFHAQKAKIEQAFSAKPYAGVRGTHNRNVAEYNDAIATLERYYKNKHFVGPMQRK
jgi:hypothetical protein